MIELRERDTAANVFHTFYDPSSVYPDTNQLIDSLVDKRKNMQIPRFLGDASIRGVLYAEQLHLTNDITSGFFGLKRDEEVYIHDAIRNQVRRVVTATNTTSSEIGISQKHDRIVIGGAVLAAYAHHDQLRGNGKPYFTHPQTVARLVEYAAQHYDAFDSNGIAKLIFLALVHDSFEDTFSIDQTDSFLNHRRFAVSPLVTRKFIPGQVGESAARTLRLLSKSRPLDETDVYLPYIELGKQDDDFCTIKIADIHHNSRLDPKPRYLESLEFSTRNYHKRVTYDVATSSLLRQIDSSPNLSFKQKIAIHAIGGVHQGDLDRPLLFSDFIERVDLPASVDSFAQLLRSDI